MSVLSSPLFKQQCYINGQWKDANSGETIDVTNPATGAVLGTVPKMGAARPLRRSKVRVSHRRNGPNAPPRSATRC